MKLYDKNYVAAALSLSVHTIKSNPAKYNMYKIGGVWRISESDLENYIDERKKNNNNVIRLALVNDNGEGKKCHYQREKASIISISARQAAKELDAQLG